MATVYFDKEHSSRVTNFCEDKNKTTKKSIFRTNMDFMIFAAMVGRSTKDSCKDIKISKSNKEIPDRIFTNGDKDGVPYLLALEGEKNGEILRDGSENELYKYIENYAFLGCQEIENWIAERPLDDLHDIVLDKIKKAAEPLAAAEAEEKSEIDLS